MNACKHGVAAFSNQNPDRITVKEYRLYKCKECRKWYSVIAIAKEYSEKMTVKGERRNEW